ncbi:MAG: hypothetical protein QOF37_1088 [Thermoleophilaceae bacterium]|nr:hypothetical protein [Thermoleophilaceae bacterium]
MTVEAVAASGLLGEDELREWVERLCAIDRPARSAGEQQAARLVAEGLQAAGGRVTLERERVHGTYWWPIGIPTALAALAALRGGRTGVALGALGAAAVADDITVGPRLFRRMLPHSEVTNVVAEFGPPDAEDVVLFVAHHDAPRAGIVFHPELPRSLARRFPKAHAKNDTAPPTMWGAVGGPALVALGSAIRSRRVRRLGGLFSFGYAAAMADIGLRATTAGANDNASGVAALVSLAHRLGADPPENTRVILLSNGAEESLLEGMAAYARRHFRDLPPERTHVVALDLVGSPHLLLLQGEGMLGIREYPKPFLEFILSCADELGIFVNSDLRFQNSTDAYIALKAGYDCALLGSCDDYKFPTDYHWYTDVPERLNYRTVADAARLCARAIERLDAGPG